MAVIKGHPLYSGVIALIGKAVDPTNGDLIRDEQGNPKSFYRGINPANRKHYDASTRFSNKAHWFTDNEKLATMYANGRSSMANPHILYSGGVKVHAHVTMSNPHIVDMAKQNLSKDEHSWTHDGRTEIGFRKERELKYARDNGHDGVLFHNALDGHFIHGGTIAAVFDPGQIHEIERLTKAIDPNDPDITKAHDVSNEPRDKNGRWTTTEIAAEQVYREALKMGYEGSNTSSAYGSHYIHLEHPKLGRSIEVRVGDHPYNPANGVPDISVSSNGYNNTRPADAIIELANKIGVKPPAWALKNVAGEKSWQEKRYEVAQNEWKAKLDRLYEMVGYPMPSSPTFKRDRDDWIKRGSPDFMPDIEAEIKRLNGGKKASGYRGMELLNEAASNLYPEIKNVGRQLENGNFNPNDPDITKARNIDILADAIMKAKIPSSGSHFDAPLSKAIDPKDKSTQSMDFDAPAEEPEENRYRMTLRPFGSFNVPNGHKLLNVEPGNGGAGYNHGYFTTDKPLPPEHIRHMDLVHEPTKDAFIYDGQRKLDQHSGHRFTAHARPLDYEGQHQVYDYTTNKDPYHYGIGDYPVHKEDDINHHWNHLMPDTQQNRDAYGADWDKDVRDDIKKAAEYPDITKAHDVSGEARDTVGKWTKGNPLFQKPDQTDTPAFRKWFGDSTVVDDEENPKVVYHSSQNTFKRFLSKYKGLATKGNAANKWFEQTANMGHWFSENDVSNEKNRYNGKYRNFNDGTGKVEDYEIGMQTYPVFLKLSNPFEIDSMDDLAQEIEDHGSAAKMRAALISSGYDGIEVRHDDEHNSKSYVAFHSKQIKSATGNNGDFNPNDPDITKAHDVSNELRDKNGKWTKGNPLFQKPDQTQTPEFKNWFKGSKVVDAQGKPLVVYHGSTSHFDTFDPNKSGAKTGNVNSVLGHFFTDDTTEASRYAEQFGKNGGNVKPSYLSLKNPYHMPYKEIEGLAMGEYRGWQEREAQGITLTPDQIKDNQKRAVQESRDRKSELIAQGYDGIVTRIGGHNEYIAFHPEQIKSAIGNNGDFDPNNPDITKARNIDILADAIMKAMIPSSGSHFDAPLSKAIDPKDNSTLGLDFDTPALPSIPKIPNIHIAIVGSKHKHEVAGVTEFNPETGKTIHGGQFAPSHVPETPVASISMGNEQMDHRVKVLSWNLDKFKNKIEELNRRAAKLKLLPMTYTISPQLKENRASRDGDSVFEFNVHFYNIDIHGETPKLNGWTYVGMVNAKGGVPLIHSAPGQEVPERFRKKIGMCEHCNTNRIRNIMFVVRKGNVTKSIGSDCIKDFLGHGSPESIMAYLDSVADLFNGDDEDDAFGEGSRSHYSFDVPRAVEYAIVSIRKHGYKKSDEDRSTKEDVMNILYPAKDKESTQYSLKMRSDVTDEDREKATNIVNWAQTELRGSEYASNVQKIVEQGTVNEKYLGYIVSLVPVYDREMEKRLKESKSAAGNLGVPGYVGEVGKRQTFTNLTLVKQTQVGDSYSNFGPSNLYIFKDDKNNNFKYFTGKILAIDGLEQARPGFTSPRYLEVGDTVNLEASIKKHEISSYTGENDNVITRAGKITIANPTIENERITARYNSRVQLLEERIKESLSEFVNDGTITQNDADYIYIHGTNDWIKIEGAVEANLSEHQLRYIGRAIGDKINYDHEDLMFELENPPKLISDKKPAKETKVKTVVSKADSSNVKMGTRRVNMENDGVELKHDGKLITVKFDKAPEGSSIASMANAGIVWDEDHGHYTGANTPDALNAAQEAAAHHNAPYGNDTPLTKTLSRDSWSHRGVTFGKVHPGSSKYRMMSMPNDHEFTSHKSACDWIDKQHADAISGLSADKMKRLGLSVDGDNFKSIPGDIIKADDMVSEFTKIVKSVLPTVPCR